MLKIIGVTLSSLTALLVAPVSMSVGGTSVVLAPAPIDSYDFDSLQRGAKLYVNYCIGCHSLTYMRYTRLADDLGISEEIMDKHIAFGQKTFAPMDSAMIAQDAKEWFNQAEPPDLTLAARSRSSAWLYTYLKSFYRDPTRPSGWNNVVFDNVAMPNVLHSLQGTMVKNEDGKLSLLKAGSMTTAQYDTLAADLVNFMVYAAEPSKLTRHRVGYGVMIFLCFMIALTYLLYREYWRDIK